MSNAELDDRGVIVPCPNCGQRNRIALRRLSDPVRCGQCKRELSPPSEPIEIASRGRFRSRHRERVGTGRGRLLGAVVRPLPDGGARAARKWRRARQAACLVVKVNTEALPRPGRALRHPVHPDARRVCAGPRSGAIRRRTPRGGHRGVHRSGDPGLSSLIFTYHLPWPSAVEL